MKASRKNVSRETSWLDRPEKDVFLEGANLLDLHVNPDQVEALLTYLSELREWNKKIKLIGPAKPSEQVLVHLLDSIIPVTDIETEELSMADIGSGAGLPGIPLKIVRPGWSVAMIESRDKKAAFIRYAARLLKLDNVTVFSRKLSENAEPDIKGRFDLVTFRAFGSLKDILPMAAPMVSPGGKILAYKGPSFEEELTEAEAEMKRLKLSLTDTRHFVMPFLNRDRYLLYFKKSE